MIKVGILEASTSHGAQLVRILLHHSDVEIVWAQSSVAQGLLNSVIKGIKGDTDLSFCRVAIGAVDVVINCSATPVQPEFIAAIASDPSKVRVIETCATEISDQYVYGLCELNRKALVRGALLARQPSALAMAVELSLLPLAKHLMLNAPVSVSAATGVGGDEYISQRGSGALPECGEIASALRLVQSSFYQSVDIVEMRCGGARGLMTITSIPCAMSVGELRDLYEKSYEDHNFVHVSHDAVDTRDVAGTNKCMLHLDKSGDMLRVTCVLDPRIKGSAGNIVHIMNLLFGLHECTGLNLISTID